MPFHNRKERWAIIVVHRRAGKTVACINDLIKRAMLKKGVYGYVSPFYIQSKDVAWAYFKEFTSPFLEHGCQYNESELKITLPNKSIIRLYGADNYDRLRGLGFDGVVLDEAADFPPQAWPEVIRPALADKKGWAVWIGTPKCHNSFYETWTQAQGNPDWFSLRLKAEETKIIDSQELAEARKTMSEDQYRQEFGTDFEAAILGAYYGKELRLMEEDGRITTVPYDTAAQVHVCFWAALSGAGQPLSQLAASSSLGSTPSSPNAPVSAIALDSSSSSKHAQSSTRDDSLLTANLSTDVLSHRGGSASAPTASGLRSCSE